MNGLHRSEGGSRTNYVFPSRGCRGVHREKQNVLVVLLFVVVTVAVGLLADP